MTEEGTLKLHICGDFQNLNEITENEVCRIPNLVEILKSLDSYKYFSTLNLASEYHQIKIDEADTHKTAFSTEFLMREHYEYLSMSFGFFFNHVYASNEIGWNEAKRNVDCIS